MASEIPRYGLVAEIVREHSKNHTPVSAEQIEKDFTDKGFATQAEDRSAVGLERALNDALKTSDDLQVVQDPGGRSFYYSVRYMSHAYAKIMVMKGSPLMLMAETTRDNSANYPRPVPLELFEQTPFDLDPEVIQECLREMTEDKQYKDIAFTTTSEGTIYLYSTDFLDHDYAAVLAEREDVQFFTDP
jgi:hypothetical protein